MFEYTSFALIGHCGCTKDVILNPNDVKVIDRLDNAYLATIYINNFVTWVGSVQWTINAVKLFASKLRSFSEWDKYDFINFLNNNKIEIDVLEAKPELKERVVYKSKWRSNYNHQYQEIGEIQSSLKYFFSKQFKI